MPVRELSAETAVKAPGPFAVAFLNTFIEDQRGAHGEAALNLHFPLHKFFGGLVLERAVTVHVEYLPKDGGTRRLAIGWEPEDTTLFPRFDGTIEAVPVDERSATLRIGGTYDVPLGVAGVLFDAVVGVRIARATLDGLLAEFKERIEDDYRARTGM